jgi:hypothetical protein
VLGDIISHNQSAFIPGQLITENVLVAFKAHHGHKIKGKRGFYGFKAQHDRVEWKYLEAIIRRLGFADRWVRMTMTCVRTVSFLVLINGQPHGKIIPSWGIRQGDPLSPYFFIICVEGLSSLLNKAEVNGRIMGFPITRGGTRVNHLFFADDSLLFYKANIFEWMHIITT